jgi:hypothetical protein
MSDDEELLRDQYDVGTFVRRVTSVRDPAMRRRQIQRHLLTVDAGTAAAHLQHVLGDAVRGSGPCREVLVAFGDFCLGVVEREAFAIEAVHLAARLGGHEGAAFLLSDPPPARVAERGSLRRERGRALTLGERRAAASGWDPRMLERLVYDNEPMVIERLCANPRLTEAQLLTVATRRPTLPEILEAIARHPRWSMRPAVREALVYNPFGPTGVALRILPLLPVQTLAALPHAGELHTAVREFAAYLTALRRADPPATEAVEDAD